MGILTYGACPKCGCTVHAVAYLGSVPELLTPVLDCQTCGELTVNPKLPNATDRIIKRAVREVPCYPPQSNYAWGRVA